MPTLFKGVLNALSFERLLPNKWPASLLSFVFTSSSVTHFKPQKRCEAVEQCDHPGGRINSPPNSPPLSLPTAEGSGNAFPASSMEEAVAAVTSL